MPTKTPTPPPVDVDDIWLNTFIGSRLNVARYFWRNTRDSSRVPCEITSINPSHEHGAYFGFETVPPQQPRQTYWMNYKCLKRFVDRSNKELRLPKIPPTKQTPLQEMAPGEQVSAKSNPGGNTPVPGENPEEDEVHGGQDCPYDVEWLRSIVGARLQVRAYYWEAYHGNRKYPASVTKVHPEKRDGAYFQFQLDADLEQHRRDSGHKLPGNYFLNYASLLEFVDKDDPGYGSLRLPKNPPANPKLECDSSSDDERYEDDGCEADDDEPSSKSHVESEYKCYLCGDPFDSVRAYGIHISSCKNKGLAFAMASPHRHKHYNKKARKQKPITVEHNIDAFTAEARRNHLQPQDRAVTRDQDRLFAQPSMVTMGRVAVCNRVLEEVEAEVRRGQKAKDAVEMAEAGSPKRKGTIQSSMTPTLPGEDPDFGDNTGTTFDDDAFTPIDLEDMETWDDDDDDVGDEESFIGEPEKENPDRMYAEDNWLPFVVRSGTGEFHDEIERETNLPPYYVMQICLLKLLEEHSSTDLCMHERILNIMHHFSTKYPDMWAQRNKYKHHTRKAMVKFLAKHFGSTHYVPSADTLYIDQGKKRVTVPTFDFKKQMSSILTDSSLMVDENFVDDPKFDKETLRPTKAYQDYADNDIIDEPTTGMLYHQGVEMYCPSDEKPPPDVDTIVPLPCILYADEVSTCAHGDLSIENVVVVPAFFNHQTRSKLAACRTLGAVPNLGAGHGKYANNYDDEYVQGLTNGKKIKSSAASLQKAKDYQEIYRHILKSFKQCCDEGGLRVMFRGKRCLFKPFVIGALGDAKGLNIWVNHYNCNGSAAVNCLVKDCHCTELDIVPPRCVPITREERQRAVRDPYFAQEISYHPVKCALDELPLADIVEGASGITPYDILHTILLGIVPDGIKFIHDLIGKKKSGAAMKEAVDLLFGAVHHHAHRRNSNKDIPIASHRFGVMDLSRRTALEQLGNYLLLMICLMTSRGKEIFDEVARKRGITISLDEIIYTMTLVLSYVRWLSMPKTKWDLDHAEVAVVHLMTCIKTHLPIEKRRKVKGSNDPGSNGYDKIKFHALHKVYRQQFKYGSSRVYDTAFGENHHKITANQAGERTQRRQSTFTLQTSVRNGEREVIENSFRLVESDCPKWKRHRYDKSSVEKSLLMTGDVSSCQAPLNLRGEYRSWATFRTDSNGRSAFTFNVVWKQRAKMSVGVGLNQFLINSLCTYCGLPAISYQRDFIIDGFTELGVPSPGGTTIFRVSESFYGIQRNDWALMNESGPDHPLYEQNYYIAQIVGIFRFRTPGFPTPKSIMSFEDEGGGALTINKKIWDQQTVDQELYVAVRPSKEFFRQSDLQEQIGMRFELEGVGEQVLITPASAIRDSLIVVPDFGATNSASYINILPQKHWGGIFSTLIRRRSNVDDIDGVGDDQK